MAEFPAFPLWTDAYLADTHHLSTIEHGAYLLLLMAMWRNKGLLPNDDRLLAKFSRLGPNQWQRVKPTIMAFFTVQGDAVTQGRLTDELTYVREHAKKQAKNARARWGGKTAPQVAVIQHPESLYDGADANPLENNNVGYAVAMPNRCQTDAPTPTPTPIIEKAPGGALSEPAVPDPAKPARSRKGYPTDFEAAWQAYPTTKNMSKAEALPAWRKLSVEDRALVLPSIPGYVAFLKSKPDLETLHFCRYLSKRRFEGYAEEAAKPATEADWRQRLIYARNRSIWSTAEWGPVPGDPGCNVPRDLLQAGDGVGWQNKDKPRHAQLPASDPDAAIYRGVL